MIARAIFVGLTGCTFAAGTSSLPRSTTPGASTASTAPTAPTAPPPEASTASTGPTSSTSSTAAREPDTAPPGAVHVQGTYVDTRGFFFPVSPQPVDPWAGVVDGKPLTMVFDKFWWQTSTEKVDCTAVRDHCLPAASWMWVADATVNTVGGVAKPMVFTQDGPTRPSTTMPVPPDAFVAYRTVPVTKQTLVEGARIVVFPSKPIPDDPWSDWHVGSVTKVDWDMGFVYISSQTQPYFITAARLPVIVWDATRGVQQLGATKPRAVATADVIVP